MGTRSILGPGPSPHTEHTPARSARASPRRCDHGPMSPEHSNARARDRIRGIQLIATTPETLRTRRPLDAMVLAVAAAGLVWLSFTWEDDGNLANRLAGALQYLPDLVTSILVFGATLAVLWSVGQVLVLGIVGWRRRGLSRDVLLAAIGAPAAAMLLFRVASGSWPDIDGWNWMRTAEGFPALSLVLVVAILRTTRPHLTRPMRLIGSALAGAAFLGPLADQTSTGSAILGGYLLGAAVASCIHLVFGTPEGQPDVERSRAALEELGVDVAELALEPTMQWGGTIAHVVDAQGRHLTAKLYGRDAYDAQVLNKVWSFLWYQQSGPSLPVTRLQQVEHEAFLSLLAEARGARAATVVTSGVDTHDNAILVLDEPGTPLDEAPADAITEAVLDDVWSQAVHLADAGIVHGALHSGNLLLDDGRVVVTGFARARLEVVGDEAVRSDQAELLVATASLVGDDRAIAAARRALGDDDLTAVLAFLQPAALSRRTRKDLDREGTRMDALKSEHRLSGSGARVAQLRAAVSGELGVEEPKVEKLVRVSWGGLAMAVVLLFALSMVLSQLADVGWDTVSEAIQGATWGWVLVGFLVGQLQSVGTAFAVLGACLKKLPLGPTVAEQFAGKFIDLAVPSSAGRIALNIRYFQRFGIPSTTAVTQGAIAGFGGFVVQAVVVLLALTVGGVDLNLSSFSSSSTDTSSSTTSTDSGGFPVWIALAVIALVIVGLVVVLRRKDFRTQILDKLKDATGVLAVFRDPRKVGLILFGNLVAQVVLAISLSACTLAFGYHVSFWTLLLINTAIAMLAGILPIPGGMGVAEAGITAGLTAAGVPQASAVGAMIMYRLSTYYLPPIWGYAAMAGLRRREYL